MKQVDHQTNLNVAIVIDTLARAGAQRQAAMLAAELGRLGHGATIVLLEHPAGEPLPTVMGATVNSVPVGPLNRPAAAGQLLALRRALRQLKPDVVHTFLFKANLVGAAAARLAGVPVVVGSRRSLGYDMNGRRARLAALGNLLVDGVAVNAQAIVAAARQREGRALRDPIVIPNGVAGAVVPPAARDEGPCRLGILGNVRPVKGHDVALEALAHLISDGLDCELHLMGDRSGDPAWAAAVDAAAQRLGVAGRITWHAADGDPFVFLSGLDILLSPSRSEGLSNAILEGMTAGLPVVATDVGGSGEALGEAGVLVPAGDPAALAAAVRKLASDPAAARELGRRARHRAAMRFSPAAMATRHVVWYRWLLRTADGSAALRRRRVVLAIDILDTGGTETQVRHWALGLADRGIPVTIICLRAGGRVARQLADAGVDVVVLDKTRRIDPLFLLRQQWTLLRLRPRTVVGLLTTAGLWTVPAARLAGVPHVLFSMRATCLTDDPAVAGPTGLLSRSLRWAQLVVGNSPEVLDFCRGALAVPAGKTAMLPNIITGGELRGTPRAEVRLELGLPVDAPLFGIVARLVPVKDHDLFLDVCVRVAQQMPRARALVVGDGPEGERIAAAVEARGLTGIVTMVGHRPDAARWLRAVDAAVLTSRSEGSPNAVLEALAVGTPVVSVNVGDVARFIGADGGRVVDERDPAAMAEALVTILRKRNVVPPFSLVERHDPERVMAQLVGLVGGRKAVA